MCFLFVIVEVVDKRQLARIIHLVFFSDICPARKDSPEIPLYDFQLQREVV